MDTFFASAERSSYLLLKEELELLTNNSFIDALMLSTSGFVAIINENRQIITLNSAMLLSLGITDPQTVFGLRPGEAINCIHARDQEGGCGTSRFCSTCGAAVAIVSAQKTGKPVEKICAAQTFKEGETSESSFKVQAVPFNYKDKYFTLLFIHDITDNQRLLSLEQIFYHDINNILTGLVGAAGFINPAVENKGQIDTIKRLADRLQDDVRIQQILSSTLHNNDQVSINSFTVDEIIFDLKEYLKNLDSDIKFEFEVPSEKIHLKSDYSMLFRILINMSKNAYEASSLNDLVKLTIIKEDHSLTFSVWNKTPIPADIQLRIFQKYFSTKKGEERGMGTYSMKLLGENFLKGEVSFRSSEKEGTTFFFKMKL